MVEDIKTLDDLKSVTSTAVAEAPVREAQRDAQGRVTGAGGPGLPLPPARGPRDRRRPGQPVGSVSGLTARSR